MGLWGRKGCTPHEGRRGEGTMPTNEEFMVPVIWVWDMHGGREVHIVEGVELVCYLSCSEGMSCNTSSHRWVRLYFPRFLLREGPFTQMYMASLIVLVGPCASLPIRAKNSRSTWCPVVWLCRWMVTVPWGVPWVCHQKSCQIPLCIVQDSPGVNICNGR